MNYDSLDKSFIRYLNEKGIKCVDEFEDDEKYKEINLETIRSQIVALSEFHTRTLGYTGYMSKRLENNIGKTIEQYKIYIKRLNKLLNKLKKDGANNDFENMIITSGEEYLERAKKCIDVVYNSSYIPLILRSMERVEMCLGTTYFNNLRYMDGILIKSINGCCYNMVEMDMVCFATKLKKKGIDTNFYNLIEEFSYKECLSKDSVNFMLALISYPYEFMKCCNRYKEKSKNWTEEEYLLRIHRAIKLDGDSLV